jgi:hypothetical protein
MLNIKEYLSDTVYNLRKIVLSRTQKGCSAVPIRVPFEEPFLVPWRTLLVSMKNPVHRGFYMWTAKEPFWNPFF